MTTHQSPSLLTLSEAAQSLRVSVDTLTRRANLGEITTVRIGRRRLVAQADIDAFIARSREERSGNGW